MQVLPFPIPFCFLKLEWYSWWGKFEKSWDKGTLSRRGFVFWKYREYCLLLGRMGEDFNFSCFIFYFPLLFLLTVAESCVFDFQQHPHRTSSLLHGTFTGICGVVAGAHHLIRPTLWAGLIAVWAATPAHPSIPQTLLSCTALDVLTRLGLWMEIGRNQQLQLPL